MLHMAGEIVRNLFWGAIVLWCALRVENGFIQVGRAILYLKTTEKKKPEAAKEKDPIYVEKKEFEADPLTWCRKASTEQRVIVRNEAGRVTFEIGGSMNVAPL